MSQTCRGLTNAPHEMPRTWPRAVALLQCIKETDPPRTWQGHGTRTYRVHCKGGEGEPPSIGISPCTRNCGSPQIPLWHRSDAGPWHLLPHTGQPLSFSNTIVAQVRSRSVALTAPHQTTSELCKYHCGTGPRQVRASCCPTQDRQ